ncbi:hypothetical protein CIPAW_03G262300 [Carya illinoinensis]|uniref:Secreted protein n=1 Tax=Carya illinoinensis TaxID=32201 RepID=A0A8T1R748_CARIL|nr:hypothetical protein CIPAW_03G262300 [Carya illinoinensis]
MEGVESITLPAGMSLLILWLFVEAGARVGLVGGPPLGAVLSELTEVSPAMACSLPIVPGPEGMSLSGADGGTYPFSSEPSRSGAAF